MRFGGGAHLEAARAFVDLASTSLTWCVIATRQAGLTHLTAGGDATRWRALRRALQPGPSDQTHGHEQAADGDGTKTAGAHQAGRGALGAGREHGQAGEQAGDQRVLDQRETDQVA